MPDNEELFLDVVPPDMHHWFVGLAMLDVASHDRAHIWMNREVVCYMPCGDENCCCVQIFKGQEPVIHRFGCEHGERVQIFCEMEEELTQEIAELSIEELRQKAKS